MGKPLPNSSHDWEPLELKLLKRQIKNITCGCQVCKDSEIHFKRIPIAQNHKETQAEQQNICSSDRYTQARPNSSPNDNNSFLRTDALCPSCFLTLNLLRGTAPKVFKDEVSETKPEMFCRDKCTGKRLKFTEKATSVTCKPQPKYSNFSLSDEMSEYSSDLLPTDKKKHERVTFFGLKDDDMKEQDITIPCPEECLCLDNYVDSIRPPLDMHIWGK